MERNRKNPISFFFDEFHSGTINVIAHCAGFALLGYGLGIGSIYVITLSTFIMELGHFYNALRDRYKIYAVLAIPAQWIFWMLIVWGGYIVDQLVRSKK